MNNGLKIGSIATLMLLWLVPNSTEAAAPNDTMTEMLEFHLQKIANKIGPPAFLILCETSNNPRAEFDAMCLAPDAMFYPLQEIPSVVISPMSNTSCSYEKCVGIPKKDMSTTRKRVSHKRYLSSGRKTEKAPLERQVTFDPARIVPWESPAGSRKPTNQQQENTSSLRPKISPNIRNFSRSKCRMMRKNSMLQSLVTKQITTKHGFFQ